MEQYLQKWVIDNDIEMSKTAEKTLTKIVDNKRINELVKEVSIINNEILAIFNMYREKEEFKEAYFPLPNASVRKKYDFTFDLEKFPHIKISKIIGLSDIQLSYDSENMVISGTPPVATTMELQIVFSSDLDESRTDDIKTIQFIINPDPKDLWKDIPSDQNQRYGKEDNSTFFGDFMDKKIVVASKRGRSHAHEGSFRDDHFTVAKLENNWEIIAVADGAGSAKYSRQGSTLATESICDFFKTTNELEDLEGLVVKYENLQKNSHIEEVSSLSSDVAQDQQEQPTDFVQIKSQLINILYRPVLAIHKQLIAFAETEGILLKDLHTTLIFTLVKKFEFGYVILSFGVGDCPINIIHTDFKAVKLLNTLDVGDFGGGTRFITMPEIFSSKDMAGRFGIQIVPDFDKLILMTDGIYDPKFVTENKLEDLTAWENFISDLDGNNEESLKVDFSDDTEVKEQLLAWMDFWSKGNHDDRTLAIIY